MVGGVLVDDSMGPLVHNTFLETGDSLDTGALIGSWKLISASSTDTKGQRSETPYNAEPTGSLTYTADGRVAALISYGGRKPISMGATGQALLEEHAEAFKTFIGYGGRYTLNGDRVIHHIEVSSIQNFVGRDLSRNVKFD